MTLLITVFAAVISTVVWYRSAPKSEMRVGVLSLVYWGASLMWLIDAVVEYIEAGAEFFSPSPSEMLNDMFLGLSVVALGSVVWLVILLIRDPKGVIKSYLLKKK